MNRGAIERMTVKHDSFLPYPLKFQAIAQERIWGGHELKLWFGVEETQTPIGEYWVLSAHPHGMSIVTNGPLAGKTLSDVVQSHPAAYLGQSPQPRFPLLIKFLDAADDLSVQVHPDDAYAQKREGDYGKTEAWYVIGCSADSAVIYGHDFPDKASYEHAVATGTVKQFLKYEHIKPGDTVFVPAQTLHALLAGTQVIEVQQTSDVTYRVYDWDRVDKEGNRRDLHVDKAGDVINYASRSNPVSPSTSKRLEESHGVSSERLVSCPYFTIEKWSFAPGRYRRTRGKVGSPDILIGVGGEGRLLWENGTLEVRRADTVLVPTTLETYELETDTTLEVLRVTY